MDKGLYTGLVMIDLQKAFDTVNHRILLHKLKAIGADETVVKWFSSYLSNREQFVIANGSSSAKEPITCGVPQGSILGPLLFIIYVNDMEQSVNCELFLYADDSALLVSGKCVAQIEQSLSENMNSLKQWLDHNRLSLHLGKTESILFATKYKLRKSSQLSVYCNETPILPKANVKYLGLTFDQDLSRHSIGNNAVQRINNGLKFLYRKGHLFNTKEKKDDVFHFSTTIL